jgi:hypothetical protein
MTSSNTTPAGPSMRTRVEDEDDCWIPGERAGDISNRVTFAHTTSDHPASPDDPVRRI